MDYRAVINLDYNRATPNEQNRLTNALCQAGWSYAETSAVYLESKNLDEVRLALEILARSIEVPGQLSALTIQVQLVGEERDPPAATNHPTALEKMLEHDLPDRPTA